MNFISSSTDFIEKKMFFTSPSLASFSGASLGGEASDSAAAGAAAAAAVVVAASSSFPRLSSASVFCVRNKINHYLMQSDDFIDEE